MMTGDSQPSAEAVARRLGIDEVHAGLLPAGKVDLVERLRASGSTVAMVGDGINDAPALMQANVGIAMGNGTHVARESADVVLVSSDLGDLTQAIHTARRTRGIIMTNFVGTIAVDLIGMAMAATGVLGPLAELRGNHRRRSDRHGDGGHRRARPAGSCCRPRRQRVGVHLELGSVDSVTKALASQRRGSALIQIPSRGISSNRRYLT